MKFNSKEEFIAEAERRGLKEGVAFRCVVENDDICIDWDWSMIDFADSRVWIDKKRMSYKMYDYHTDQWATPLETPLEDRVKALEEEITKLKAENGDSYIKCKKGGVSSVVLFDAETGMQFETHFNKTISKEQPTQSSRHFIMEGIIEKIYPKDKEKALEALVNLARVNHEPLDKEKKHEKYSSELVLFSMSGTGNSFDWEESKQGHDYWEEIHDLLK